MAVVFQSRAVSRAVKWVQSLVATGWGYCEDSRVSVSTGIGVLPSTWPEHRNPVFIASLYPLSNLLGGRAWYFHTFFLEPSSLLATGSHYITPWLAQNLLCKVGQPSLRLKQSSCFYFLSAGIRDIHSSLHQLPHGNLFLPGQAGCLSLFKCSNLFS